MASGIVTQPTTQHAKRAKAHASALLLAFLNRHDATRFLDLYSTPQHKYGGNSSEVILYREVLPRRFVTQINRLGMFHGNDYTPAASF